MNSRHLNSAINYAVLSLVFRLVAAQSGVLSLWFQRRCYERSRGEMITMVYAKTLSRKTVSSNSEDGKNEVGDVTQDQESLETDEVFTASAQEQPWATRLMVWKKSKAASKPDGKIEGILSKAAEPSSMGKILNLARNDVYEVAQRFWEFQSLITKPLGLVFSLALLWQLIGWSCLVSVLTVIIAQLLNVAIVKLLLSWEKRRRATTDRKIHVVTQFLEAIRHLRYLGWADVWLVRIMEARDRELTLRIVTGLLNILIGFTNTLANGLLPVAAFYAYTVIAKQPLRTDIAFPALQLLTILTSNLRDLPGLITVFLNAFIAMGRIESFMKEPDIEQDDAVQNATQARMELVDATFAWPGKSGHVLKTVSLSFPEGLTVILGPVGGGKSALLQALLGELDCLGGELRRSSSMIGYCAQRPWLQSMSIRDNILFSAPYEPERYNQVLQACALTTDLAAFKHGDLSDLGENGVGLSGGQRARIALARAVYSRAEILLLDDPLSALDHQTAEIIVQKCLTGPLVEGRTVVLVTHRTELCQTMPRQVVRLDHGRVDVLHDTMSTTSTIHPVTMPQTTVDAERRDEASTPEKFLDEERRAHGNVKAMVYWEYIKAGRMKWWILAAFAMIVYRTSFWLQTYFLERWSEAYQREDAATLPDPFRRLPSPEVNLKPWLVGFLLIAIAQAVTWLLTQCLMLTITYCAGKHLFRSITTSVSRAKLSFYDRTPVGRLINRLTSDMQIVDGSLGQQLSNSVYLLILWISSLVVIATVTPIFIVFSLILTICFILIFRRFLPTSQSLRRLEVRNSSNLQTYAADDEIVCLLDPSNVQLQHASRGPHDCASIPRTT